MSIKSTAPTHFTDTDRRAAVDMLPVLFDKLFSTQRK